MANSTASFSLAGKNALVTGASRGIGRAIALGLAEAGANVAVLGRAMEDLQQVAGAIAELGHHGLPVRCDVTEADDVLQAAASVLDAFSSIDVLVNNAGGPVFNAPFLDVRPEGWARVLDLNLTSVVSFCRVVGKHMVERGRGSVINVDSIGASHPAPLVAPYCAAKAGVISLTQTLAQEWGPSGVRINALSPGMIDTAINRALVADTGFAEQMAQRIPLRRWGEANDLVGAAIWLASDASSYVTGAVIPVNGGLGVVAPQRLPDP